MNIYYCKCRIQIEAALLTGKLWYWPRPIIEIIRYFENLPNHINKGIIIEIENLPNCITNKLNIISIRKSVYFENLPNSITNKLYYNQSQKVSHYG